VRAARWEIYVWHLTPPWNSLYFVTLAAQILPTAAGPCCPSVGAGLLGPANAPKLSTHCYAHAAPRPGLCSPCTAGTFRSMSLQNESDTHCLQCPANHYCPPAATHPLPCPAGEVSFTSSHSILDDRCKSGFGRNESNCIQCARGFFSITSSNLACTPCPLNKTTLSTATANELSSMCMHSRSRNCIFYGKFSIPCSVGPFAEGFKNEQCTSCGWASVSIPTTTATNSDSCQCNTQMGVAKL